MTFGPSQVQEEVQCAACMRQEKLLISLLLSQGHALSVVRGIK